MNMIYIYLAIGVFILTILGGSYFLYKSDQDTIAQLNQQVAAQTVKTTAQDQAIGALEARIKIVEELKTKLDNQVQQHQSDAQREKNKIHSDITPTPSSKPADLEVIVNKDTKQLFDDLTTLSAVPLKIAKPAKTGDKK